MQSIYSFLQKRKMHESQHGFFMVVIAYVLSFIMLILGSDVFYNINSAAAGISVPTEEEAKEVINSKAPHENELLSSYSTQLNLLNPYGLTKTPRALLTEERDEGGFALEGDTFWLLGSAMDSGDIGMVLEHMNQFIETTSTETVSLAEEELHMLERIVEAEATGEDIIGKILIANVVFNRMADEEFPDTVEEVIFHEVNGEYQFSPVDDKRFWSVKITKETEEAVQRALQGEDYSKGALYFMSKQKARKSSARWFEENLKWLFKHGGHDFYKNN